MTAEKRDIIPSLIDIRLGKRKGIAKELQSWLGAVRDDYLDDVEAKQNVGVIQEPEPGEPAAGNSFALVVIHRIERPTETFPRARFDFDENKRVSIAADDIDFAASAAAEITIQDLVTVPPQEPARQVLPACAKPKMPGRRSRRPAAPPVRKIGDESDKARVHAI